MKLKILTVILIITYVLSFIPHIKDFSQGFNESQTDCVNNQKTLTINVIQPIQEGNFKIPNFENSYATKSKIVETINIEAPNDFKDYLHVPMLFVVFFSFFLIPTMLIIVFQFFKNFYKGEIVSQSQISRLRFLGFLHLAYAIIENLSVLSNNYQLQKLADFYSLTVIKNEYTISIFFIPLILLLITEVLKQHLRLKEESDLTI